MSENTIEYHIYRPPKKSKWTCYLFGNRPGKTGITWTPDDGQEPNWFIRFMMRVCFDCLWVKENKK